MRASVNAIGAVRVHMILQGNNLLKNSPADRTLENLFLLSVHFDMASKGRVVQEPFVADFALQWLCLLSTMDQHVFLHKIFHIKDKIILLWFNYELGINKINPLILEKFDMSHNA
jgi:hypothetical protein